MISIIIVRIPTAYTLPGHHCNKSHRLNLVAIKFIATTLIIAYILTTTFVAKDYAAVDSRKLSFIFNFSKLLFATTLDF